MYTHTHPLPRAVQSLTAEREDEVSHYFISPTNCTAEPLLIHWEALQNQGRFQTQTAFAKGGQGGCFAVLPATALGHAFPKLLGEGKLREESPETTRIVRTRWWWQKCPSQPCHLSLHYSDAQSLAVDFCRLSAQITDGQPRTLLPVSKRILPRNVPWVWASQPRSQLCWKLLREQCQPFAHQAECSAGSRQEQGEAAQKA